ncbi:anaerobic ribonucleoside-triphosphate reductase activating protein [Pontiellaceae bacterium B12227]|nr:anaerobic ribonucleoside-triphosphate reductase activating protein [Pontiellaceae bacterium B12227]
MPETSPIYAYLEKPSMVDYPKHFAAVFFTSGCNFSCGFCHNATLMGKKQKGLSWERMEQACTKFKKDWVNGVVITGGEPTMADDLVELIHFFKKFGFDIKLDTNGSNPDLLAECLPLVDYVAMDVKTGFSGYPALVGFPDIGKIERSIGLIKTEAEDYEFRTTVIDTFHTDDQMDEVGEIIDGAKRFALQAFIPREDLPGKKFRTLPRTTSARLHEIKEHMTGCADEILLRGV